MKIEQYHQSVMDKFILIEGRLAAIEVSIANNEREKDKKENRLYYLYVPILAIVSTSIFQLLVPNLFR
jgi:hypothetical protein